MRYQQSPIPYLLITFIVLSVAIYSNFSTDKELQEPIVHVIKSTENQEKAPSLFESTELISKK
ncbi:MAG: hypothetical protein AAF487_04135 [Bacteroidota bacterium]